MADANKQHKVVNLMCVEVIKGYFKRYLIIDSNLVYLFERRVIRYLQGSLSRFAVNKAFGLGKRFFNF